jgi:hypothetical protein
MWYLIVIAALVIIGYYLKDKNSKKAESQDLDNLRKNGVDPDKFITAGTYLGGLPEISKQVRGVKFYPTKTGFDLYITRQDASDLNNIERETRIIGSIENKEIEEIIVEDKSSSEKRLSATNIALFGIAGLAMRKSDSKDISLLVIKTNDGRFKNDVVFLFQPKLQSNNHVSLELANTAKSSIVKHLKQLDQINGN